MKNRYQPLQLLLLMFSGWVNRHQQKIIDYRSRNPFTCVEDLKNVNGIGDKKCEDIRPFLIGQMSSQRISLKTFKNYFRTYSARVSNSNSNNLII